MAVDLGAETLVQKAAAGLPDLEARRNAVELTRSMRPGLVPTSLVRW